jgi:gamma-glutamylcyclotransferase (GGCT)/AIG2-like uncharacterized protein YtfP
MNDLIFVYGTLLPGRAPRDVREIVGQLRHVARGSMPGRVFDLGPFPGAVHDDTALTRVQGEVFELPESNEHLRKLDEYEEFDPSRPDQSLFVREKHRIELVDGSQVHCWVYVYNRDPGRAQTVPHGDYATWESARQEHRS